MLQSCRPTLHCRPVRYLRRSVRWPVRALCAEVPDKRVRSTAALGAVDLPHGVLWWSDRSHSVYQHNVLHGQDFVLQRPRPGGPGLILAKQLSSVQLVDQEERKRVSIQAYQMQASDRCAPLAITDILTFDVTEYALVEDAASNNLAAPCFPPTDCTGMVLVSQNSDKQQEQVKFTCKRCGVSSLKAVNPNAWATGTVFARCDGCQVIHKLNDNLELFHELAGPVLDPRPNMDQIKIPDSLPQKPYMP